MKDLLSLIHSLVPFWPDMKDEDVLDEIITDGSKMASPSLKGRRKLYQIKWSHYVLFRLSISRHSSSKLGPMRVRRCKNMSPWFWEMLHTRLRTWKIWINPNKTTCPLKNGSACNAVAGNNEEICQCASVLFIFAVTYMGQSCGNGKGKIGYIQGS